LKSASRQVESKGLVEKENESYYSWSRIYPYNKQTKCKQIRPWLRVVCVRVFYHPASDHQYTKQ